MHVYTVIYDKTYKDLRTYVQRSRGDVLFDISLMTYIFISS